MWPGIRPATGWIPKLTSQPLFSRSSVSSFHHVLGLSNRHPVPRDDGHVGRRFEHVVGIFHGDRLDLAFDHRLLVRNAGKA